MSDEKALSPLGALYLEHLKDIRAGRDALKADIQGLLESLAEKDKQRGSSNVDAIPPQVQRTWHGGAIEYPLVLRLR